MASFWPSITWTAKRSNSRAGNRLSLTIRLACAALVLVGTARVSLGCPFCTALGPTLSQLREQAVVVALAEVEDSKDAKLTRVRLHRVLAGGELLHGKQSIEIPLEIPGRPGSLLLVFGNGGAAARLGELAWNAVGVNETSYSYFARAPTLKTPVVERLRYFGPFLEHREPLIAEDAYLEFGHAGFDQVAAAAETLPKSRLRAWLTDPNVPAGRKGFYGLALGLGDQGTELAANAEFLRQLILAPEDDFRAGFDGILGGYLLLAATPGLELVEQLYLANPRAADGDVRHALTALRFYYEDGRAIPRERLQRALRCLLARPEFSAAAITDLARWQDWGAQEQIAALYASPGYGQAEIRRAIVGYLLTCPETSAAKALARLRKVDSAGVAAAERSLAPTTNQTPGQ
jgi:hypothetical protein